jgi:5-methylcytosine-specific restriction enzyme A
MVKMNRSAPLRSRAPLARRTGLKAAATLSRKPWTALQPAERPRKPRRETGFPPAVRQAIRERAGHRCEACAVPVPPGFGNIQHRLARKMGGSRDPVINSVANGALLCGTPLTGCHGLCEARDRHMHEAGFWLENGERPGEVPVLLHGEHGSGIRAWLTPEGGYSEYSPAARGAAA